MRSHTKTSSLAALFALFGLVAACGGGADLNELISELVLPPETLILDDAYVGYEKSYELTLSSKGDLPLNFQAQVFSSSRIFGLVPVVGAIPANGSSTLSIVVTPDRLGTFEAILIVQTDANRGQGTARINISLDARLPPDCEDGNGCTINRFNPSLQKCEIELREGSCDDRNLCTSEDQCINGECVGTPVTCDDNDFCTDNVCNPAVGCVFPPTRSCDDNNPCTIDRCLSPTGCEYENVEDGSLCDDFEVCTRADVCLAGVCRGVNIPDGTPCDDGDPCSKNEVCDSGECFDESYSAPDFLDTKFETTIATLNPHASANPIVDGEGNIFLGTELGIVALNICGEELWRNDNLGIGIWNEAASLPGTLFLPLQTAIVSVDTVSGDEISRVSIQSLTSSTSTNTESSTIQNMVISGTGTLIISLYNAHQQITRLQEFNPSTNIATEIDHFAGYKSHRLSITKQEELIGTFVKTTTTSSVSSIREQLHIKYDLANRGTTWSSTSAINSDTAHIVTPGIGHRLYSSSGLIYDTSSATTTVALSRGSTDFESNRGGVVVDTARIIWLKQQYNTTMEQSNDFSVIATSTTGEIIWTRDLAGTISECFPALGRFGDIFIGTQQGNLFGLRRDGTSFLNFTAAPNSMSGTTAINPTLSPQGVLIFTTGNKVIGIQISSGLARSAWPRFRRDNLSSGHQ